MTAIRTHKRKKRERRTLGPMPYPKPFQVECATQLQLARWTWLLSEPQTEEQVATVDRIKQRFKGWTTWLRKAVDWTNRIN